MELLLNLVWIAKSLAAFGVYMRKRRGASKLSEVPYANALLALACVPVLLLPFVSASDDLHTAPAV